MSKPTEFILLHDSRRQPPEVLWPLDGDRELPRAVTVSGDPGSGRCAVTVSDSLTVGGAE